MSKRSDTELLEWAITHSVSFSYYCGGCEVQAWIDGKTIIRTGPTGQSALNTAMDAERSKEGR